MERRSALERPDALLKSALEKVVFFECRLDQLTSELSRTVAENERLKADLATAAQREVSLKQELAAAESRAGQACREREGALERVQVARAERERLLDALIQGERIRLAGQEAEGVDLASFIAELRSEVLALRGSAPPPDSSRVAFTSAEDAAGKLAQAGRLGITGSDREALQASATFETKSQETLFALSLRELTSSEAPARIRAAQRLRAVGARAALPALAAALNVEQSSEVLVALLDACSAAEEPSVLPLVQARLGHGDEEVRLAALEAALKLRDSGCIAVAIADPSPRVRRRAAILASGDGEAVPMLERAMSDGDASVRRVAALGLAAAGGEQTRSVLLAALDDVDPTVRRAAAKGLVPRYGPEAFAIADLDASRRRREIRRLETRSPSTVSRPAEDPQGAARRPELEAEILSRVYAALRGESDEDLARDVRAPLEVVREAAKVLVSQGQLVRRGLRYYVP